MYSISEKRTTKKTKLNKLNQMNNKTYTEYKRQFN